MQVMVWLPRDGANRLRWINQGSYPVKWRHHEIYMKYIYYPYISPHNGAYVIRWSDIYIISFFFDIVFLFELYMSMCQ